MAFFDIFSSGNLRFADPKVQFTVENSFGFPLGVDYSGISALTENGTIIDLTGSITEQLAVVQAPTMLEQGSSLETVHLIDVSNSNIDDLFSAQPTSFRLGLSAISNPVNGPSQYNFLNELNSLAATALIEIPLDMSIDELVANQNFDSKNGEAVEQAKRALMKVNSTNEMPMGGDLEIQFLDANGDVIYTIDERPAFTAAEIGPDGRTIGEADNILRDSLGSKFNSNETQVAFESNLGTRYYLTATAFITPNDRFSLTYFKNNAFSDLPGNFALSFNHRFENFVVGAVGSYRRANTEFNLGASLASSIGPVQLYMALDNVLLLNRPEQYSKVDFRFGLNLMFGYKKWMKDKIVDLDKL